MTASDGTVVETVTYDPYGEATVTVAGGQSASGSPYLFQGRRWDGEADLYYFRNRALSPRLGRFVQRDPIGYADGMNLYQFASAVPQYLVDPQGFGPWKTRIDKIEAYLALGDSGKSGATANAFLLYNSISTFAQFSLKYALASKFMNRWLAKKGGTATLSKGKSEALLDDSGVRERWAPQLQPLRDGQHLTEHVFKKLMATRRTDYFYALGWFKVKFTGDVHRDGQEVELDGSFTIEDRYDWQKPGEKRVILFGDKIKDKYATLVEDAGKAKAFDVEGHYKGTICFDL